MRLVLPTDYRVATDILIVAQQAVIKENGRKNIYHRETLFARAGFKTKSVKKVDIIFSDNHNEKFCVAVLI